MDLDRVHLRDFSQGGGAVDGEQRLSPRVERHRQLRDVLPLARAGMFLEESRTAHTGRQSQQGHRSPPQVGQHERGHALVIGDDVAFGEATAVLGKQINAKAL